METTSQSHLQRNCDRRERRFTTNAGRITATSTAPWSADCRNAVIETQHTFSAMIAGVEVPHPFTHSCDRNG